METSKDIITKKKSRCFKIKPKRERFRLLAISCFTYSQIQSTQLLLSRALVVQLAFKIYKYSKLFEKKLYMNI